MPEVSLAPALEFKPLNSPSGRGRLAEVRGFPIGALGRRDLYVWTPDQVADGEALPVIYMQDGQNLFDPRMVASGDSWGMDGCLSRLIDEGLAPVRVVGIASGEARLRDYAPSSVLNRLPADARTQVETAYGGAARSDAYSRAVVDAVRPFIESVHPTPRGPAGAYLMGASLGAVISAEIFSRFPARFAGVGCLSAHYSLLPLQVGVPPPAFARLVTEAVGETFRADFPRADGRRVWIDRSEDDIDRFYAPSHAAITEALAGLGYRRGIDLAGGVYPGVGHNETAWRARAGEALAFLLTGRTSGSIHG